MGSIPACGALHLFDRRTYPHLSEGAMQASARISAVMTFGLSWGLRSTARLTDWLVGLRLAAVLWMARLRPGRLVEARGARALMSRALWWGQS